MSLERIEQIKALPLPEFVEAVRAWLQANQPGWQYATVVGFAGDDLPPLTIPVSLASPPEPSS